MNYFRKTALAAALSLSATSLLAADFKQLDTSNDQQLSVTELFDYAKQLPQSAEELILTFDRDGNQRLSQQEFQSLDSAPMKTAAQDNAERLDSTNQPSVSATQQGVETDRAGMAENNQITKGPESQQAVDRTTITVNQKPATVTVSNTAPKVTVRQPQPEVTITSRDPVVEVEQAEPQVSVNQAKPQVDVSPGRPAVDVEQTEPKVSVEQPAPDISTRMATPEVSVQSDRPDATDKSSEWAKQSVGDLQGKSVYDTNGQRVGEIVEVVLDPQQQAGVLIESASDNETRYVELQEIQMDQNQLRVSDAEQLKALNDLEDLNRDQLRPVSDRNRSVRSLLRGGSVSVR